jgi:hypothetical protein
MCLGVPTRGGCLDTDGGDFVTPTLAAGNPESGAAYRRFLPYCTAYSSPATMRSLIILLLMGHFITSHLRVQVVPMSSLANTELSEVQSRRHERNIGALFAFTG